MSTRALMLSKDQAAAILWQFNQTYTEELCIFKAHPFDPVDLKTLRALFAVFPESRAAYPDLERVACS